MDKEDFRVEIQLPHKVNRLYYREMVGQRKRKIKSIFFSKSSMKSVPPTA